MLKRDERATSLIALLQVMARTPAGSWLACPSFGLRDLFENGRQRADVGKVATDRINQVLTELGINEFYISDVVREISTNRDVDTYSITITRTEREESFTTTLAHE